MVFRLIGVRLLLGRQKSTVKAVGVTPHGLFVCPRRDVVIQRAVEIDLTALFVCTQEEE